MRLKKALDEIFLKSPLSVGVHILLVVEQSSLESQSINSINSLGGVPRLLILNTDTYSSSIVLQTVLIRLCTVVTNIFSMRVHHFEHKSML